MARNPSAGGQIRGSLLIGLVLIESLAIYTLLIGLVLIFLKWGT
jgi:F-type H+-transporting ATPase subunit c